MRAAAAVLILGASRPGDRRLLQIRQKSPRYHPASQNVLLAEWSGPYGGVPPFDRVKVEHFKPALETAMTQGLAEVEKIAASPEAPTFENTIAAMERSGKTLDRVTAVYDVWSGNMSSDAFRAVEQEMAPKLAEYRDTVMQNVRLFERIEKIYNARENSGLTPEQQRLVWDYYTDFLREGAKLTPELKAAVAKINKQLADLYTKFSNNLLHDEESYVLYLTKDQLGGLPESYVKAAAEAAAERKQPGKYAVLNTRSSMDPFLTYSTAVTCARKSGAPTTAEATTEMPTTTTKSSPKS